MFDQEIAEFIATGHPPDRIAHTCPTESCANTTYAPAGVTSIACLRCDRVDARPELQTQGWYEPSGAVLS